jgi:CheY-like chemotaxis protein
MARVHLVHWDPEEARPRLAALEALGHDTVHLAKVTGTPLVRALRADPPEVFLIDLSRRPSHGREIAMALRTSPATRRVPQVFVGGDAETMARMRQLLPDATFTTWGRLRAALPRAIRSAPSTPFVPPDALYAGRTVAQKLGIGAGERVAAVGAPPGFAGLLGALPKGTRLTADPSGEAQRFVWFVTSRRELEMALGRLTALVTTQVAWLAWPKQASGVKTDLNGNDVRNAGLASGLVDFKVCSIDGTWSGLAFKRPRR